MNRILKTLTLSIFVFLIQGYSLAQVTQLNRVEMELNMTDFNQMILMGKNGVVLFDKDLTPQKELILSYSVFNTELKNIGEHNFIIPDNRNSFSSSDETKIHHFFYNKKGVFTLTEFDVSTQKINKIDGNLINPKAVLTQFAVNNGKVYLGGVYKKKPYLEILDIASTKQKLIDLSALNSSKCNIYDISVRNEGKQVHVLFWNTLTAKTNNYLMLPFNDIGEEISKILLIDNEAINNLSSVSTTGLDKNNFASSGTYTSRNTSTAQGLYISKFNAEKREFIQFYNFLDFKNFEQHLSSKLQKKIERKEEKLEEKGKELKLDFFVAVHELRKRDNNLFMIGEVYYPTYRTETYWTTMPNGQRVMQTRKVFDGYQYSHAVAAKFDENGKMLWSNTFEMWVEQKPFYVKRFITTNISEKSVDLLFATGSAIKSISYSLESGDVVTERTVNTVQTGDENDKLKWTSYADLDHWYDNFYLTAGYQKIKNSEKGFGQKTRRIFYMNKVQF